MVDPPVGTVLVYATSPNGSAIDGNGRNGLFTKHLLTHLSTPGRTLDELFRMVALGVEQEAKVGYKTRQIPYRSFSFSGSYCLAGCDDPQVTTQIELVKRQSAETAARVQSLTQENARLTRQAEERMNNMRELEARIQALTSDAAAVGSQSDSTRFELARLQAALATARGANMTPNGLRQKHQKGRRRSANSRRKWWH